MARLFHVPRRVLRKVRLQPRREKDRVGNAVEDGIEQEPRFQRRNPAGKVPVLQLDGIHHVRKRTAICEYIEETALDLADAQCIRLQRL